MSNDYQNFFNILELLLFVISPEGDIVYCNDTACKRLGYTRGELIGMPVVNIHPPEQRMFAAMLVQDMLDSKADVCPIPVQCKDGSLIQVETRVSLGQWDGKPALLGVTKDVTDIKIIDEKFQTIFNAIPDLVALLDTEYRIIEVNQAMADKLGVGKRDAFGIPCYQAIHDTNCPPEFCPNVRLLADGNTHEAEVFEPRLEGSYKVTVSPIHDAQGNISGSVHVAHDITQVKLAERKFQTIFQFAPVALAITRISDGMILNVNDAWYYLTGYFEKDIQGKTMFDIHLYNKDSDRDILISKLKETHWLENEPVIMRTKHGHPIYGLFCGAPIMIGGVPCWITALNNQTQKVILEQAIINFRDTVSRDITIT